MKLADLKEEPVEECEEEEEEDNEAELEQDLSEALELLETCMEEMESRITVKKLAVWNTKDLKNLSQEISVFLDQWKGEVE